MTHYTCRACAREFKTRRSFYVCVRCASITCKRCIGRGCVSSCRGVTGAYARLIDALPRLRELGYDMSIYEPRKAPARPKCQDLRRGKLERMERET